MEYLFLPAEVEAVRREGLLDLLDRLLPEVRDRRELVLALHDQVADGLDTDPLEAVVGPHAELELLDREVLHAVRERCLRGGQLGLCSLAEALDPLDVGEDRELADEDLSSLADGLLRVDRPVGAHIEVELVVVRALADTCGLDVVGDAANG